MFLKIVLQYEGSLSLALDAGCGSGQCTDLLAPHFEKILATDISAAQIEAAKALPHPSNISFQYILKYKVLIMNLVVI